MPVLERMFRHVGVALGLIREVLRGMTQTECAQRAGIFKNQLSRYEIGAAVPALESLEKILRALDVAPSAFFAIVAAVYRLAAGEGEMEEVHRSVLRLQASALEECLSRVAGLRRSGFPATSLTPAGGRRSSAWSKIVFASEEDESYGKVRRSLGPDERLASEGPTAGR